jgi:Tol biopolymer transport system component
MVNDMPLVLGTRLGPYEIVNLLSAGGMGEVYLGRDTRLARTVAIKVLPANLMASEDRRRRFEREARTVASLNHPHICQIYDIGRQGEIDYLVMEYMEGELLSARLDRGPLPTAEVLRYSIEIVEALDTAHRQGVVHRDLKPANVMITRAGAKLMDFGLAKLKEETDLASAFLISKPPTSLTDEGMIVGTLNYMAPEQLQGKDADARSDLFSLGSMIYEMASGRKAFPGESGAQVIAAILERDPAPLWSLKGSGAAPPPALDHVVQTCLAKLPEDRWQTAHDLMLQLQWIADQRQRAAAPLGWNRERMFWLCVAATLAVACGVLGWLVWRGPAEPSTTMHFSLWPPESASFSPLSVGGPVAVAPDGRRLAFTATTTGAKQQIWIRPLDSPAAYPLEGTDGGSYPFWSPDSRDLGFFAGGKLKRIEASGGPPQTLCDAPQGRGGTWNRNGVIVFTPNLAGGLHRVSSGGGPSVPVTQPTAVRRETSHRWPAFLPDGDHFLYFARGAEVEHSGVYVSSLESRQVRRVAAASSGALFIPSGSKNKGHLLYIRERTLMAQPFDAGRLETLGEPAAVVERVGSNLNSGSAFSAADRSLLVYRSDSTQMRQIVWVDRAGRRLADVGEPAEIDQIALSPDGAAIAADMMDRRTGANDIVLIDAATGARTALTSGQANDWYPVWSPDGARIVYTSDQEGRMDLYLKPTRGLGEGGLIHGSGGVKFAMSWSRDGRLIAFQDLHPASKYDIWLLPITGDRKPLPLLQTEFNENHPQFSPDGQWLAYTSDESGAYQVYVTSLAGSPQDVQARRRSKRQISSGGGYQPRWRADGRELYYLSADRRLHAVAIGADGAPGAHEALFEAPVETVAANRSFYAPAADGRRFVLAAAVEAAHSPIHVLLHWSSRLPR